MASADDIVAAARGWTGTDDQLISTLRDIIKGYKQVSAYTGKHEDDESPP